MAIAPEPTERTYRPAPGVTMHMRVGPADPSVYRRLLEILFAPDDTAPEPNSLHTQAV